jgi:Flp pilus assembly protein TadG
MPIGALTQAQVIINGVDLTDHCSAVHLTDSRAPVDITAMGATNLTFTKGLGDGKASFDFFQDFSAAKVHATLQPLIGSTTPFTVEVRGTIAARSATNPAFLMSALLFTYPMLDGKIGDANSASYEFQNASQAGVTYPTA